MVAPFVLGVNAQFVEISKGGAVASCSTHREPHSRSNPSPPLRLARVRVPSHPRDHKAGRALVSVHVLLRRRPRIMEMSPIFPPEKTRGSRGYLVSETVPLFLDGA